MQPTFGEICISLYYRTINRAYDMENLIRFDWAMKRLLRDKSNFVVLEGFLSVLLGEKITIDRFLESESNQDDANDKFNRADILAIDSKERFIIIEVQNNRELSYFHRMLYGVSMARITTRCARCIQSTSYISNLDRARITFTTGATSSVAYTMATCCNCRVGSKRYSSASMPATSSPNIMC